MDVAKGEKIIEIPQGVDVKVEGNIVKVKTPKGEISKKFTGKEIKISLNEGKISVLPLLKKKSANARATTAASIIKSMVEGGKGKEFVYTLEIVYSHFPITVAVKEGRVEVSNLFGGKKAKVAKIIGDTKVEVKGKTVVVKGHDKQAAGQTAANIENCTKTSGTDRRIFQDGIYIVEKAK